MKKTTILFVLAALVACNQNPNQETKNTKVLWAENAKSILPMEADTSWSIEVWIADSIQKEKIFSSITHAVLSGKLKAYADYPNKEFTVQEFKNTLVKWDSSVVVEDPNNSGVMINAPLLIEVTPDNIVQINFNEKIEFDTLSYTINKKVSIVSFFSYKYNANWELCKDNKKVFDVKLNN